MRSRKIGCRFWPERRLRAKARFGFEPRHGFEPSQDVFRAADRANFEHAKPAGANNATSQRSAADFASTADLAST